MTNPRRSVFAVVFASVVVLSAFPVAGVSPTGTADAVGNEGEDELAGFEVGPVEDPVVQGEPLDLGFSNAVDEAGEPFTGTVGLEIERPGADSTVAEVAFEDGEAAEAGVSTETGGIPPGTYDGLGVEAVDDASVNDTYDVEIVAGPEFTLHDVEMNETAVRGENITATATVENEGDTADEQIVTYEIVEPGVDVAFVTDDDEQAVQELRGPLAENLDDGVYTVDHVNTTELLDEMPDYDVFVVYEFDGTASEGGGELAADFLDALADDQGAVYVDGEAHSGAIRGLTEARGDPAVTDQDFVIRGTEVEIEITEDHPLFDGVGDADDTVLYNDHTGEGWGWFSHYDGNTVAYVSQGGWTDGSAIGVDDDRNEVLLGSYSATTHTPGDSYTDDAHQITANAVEHVASGGQNGGVAGESVLAVETAVELAPGEQEALEFEVEGSEVEPGTYVQVLGTADDEVNTNLTVVAGAESFAVGIDEHASELHVVEGEDVTVEATVENTGEETASGAIDLAIDGLGADSTTVTLDPSESTTVTLAVPTGDGDADPAPYEAVVSSANGTEQINVTATEETGVEGAVLGDVTGDGEVGLTDSLLVQEHVAGVTDLHELGYDVNMADMTRDGHVTMTDAILVTQRYNDEIESKVEVSDLDADETVTAGEHVEVTVQLTNVAEMGALQTIEAQLVDGEDELAVEERHVDMARAGVTNPVDLPAETELSFALSTDGVSDGTYELVVASENDQASTSTEVLPAPSPEFEVTDASIAESQIEVDESVEATAQIQNEGDAAGQFTTMLQADGTVVDSESVSLDPGEEQTMSLTTTFEEAGEYEIRVGGDLVGTVSVVEPTPTATPDPTPTSTPDPTPTSTPEPTPTSTPEPTPTSTPEPTPTATPDPTATPTPTETDDEESPGFGAAVALLALLAAALLAARRRG